jgi:NitT/TauT family transport system substrate-binding protein
MEVTMKAFFTALLAFAGALAAAAPSIAADDPAVAKFQGDGGVLRLTNQGAGTNAFAVFAMQKFKLDKKYGFEMQIIPAGNSQAAMTAVQSGGADVVVADLMMLASLRNAGGKIIAIVPMFKWGDHIVVPTNSPIHNLGDLRGKKVGTDTRNDTTWFVIRAAAKKTYNLDLEKDADVQEGGVGLLRGLIEQGKLDATFMYNNITPAMTVTGKFRVLYQMRDLLSQLGLDGDVPFLFHAAAESYTAAHPANVRAYLAAYREAVAILNVNDEVWIEAGHVQKMADAAIPPLRDEMRADLMSKFEPHTEADIRNMFDILLATAGPKVLGMSKLPDVFMTLQYQ